MSEEDKESDRREIIPFLLKFNQRKNQGRHITHQANKEQSTEREKE